MRKSLLWFIFVVICVHLTGDVYGKSASVVSKHGRSEDESGSKELSKIKKSPTKSDEKAQQESKTKDEEQKKKENTPASTKEGSNENNGNQTSSKITSEGGATKKDESTSADPKLVSKHVDTSLQPKNSEENIKKKDQSDKSESKDSSSIKKENESLPRTNKMKEQKDKKDAKLKTEENSKVELNTPSSEEKMAKQGKNNVQLSKNIKDGSLAKKGEEQNSGKKGKSKASVPHTTQSNKEKHNSELKAQTKTNLNASPPSKNKPLSAEKKSKVTESESKISSDKSRHGKSQKRAKKILVSFFHSELDDNGNAPDKKTDVAKVGENGKQSTQDDLSHTRDEETTLAELSDKLYKRTGFQPQPEVANENNKVIETVLPSGPSAVAPQHIRLSGEPTHVIFKPLHKYYPAIHRYMTKPIHRYLKKPVDLNGANTPLEDQEFMEGSPTEVKGYTSTPSGEQSVGVPQILAKEVTPQRVVSGGLVNQGKLTGSPLKEYVSPLGRGQKVGIPQIVQASDLQPLGSSGGLVNDEAPGLQAKHYSGNAKPNPVAGGLVRDHNVIQGHVGPVRIFTQLPPRIQPVLIHPHRLSPTGFGPCSTSLCKNGGVCSTVRDQAMCICKPGFRGKFCEISNKCHPNPCHNYGTCTENERDFECTCKKGYRGKKCEVENKCEPNPCVNGGTCSESEDDYVCTCREGYFGHSCEAESKCNPINPCKNGATCQEAHDTYKCFCREGFGGYNCEARIRRNTCLPNPCKNGGFCTITGTSTGNHTCSCLTGWKGPTCVEKVDSWGTSMGPTICESVNPCMFGGKCTPVSYYDYTCTCPHGRGGAHCEKDLHHPKFVSSCSNCHAFARCLDGHCACKEGYQGDGIHCEPVKQFCHPNPCYNGGTCRQSTNHKRSVSSGKEWWCECPTGYKGLNCQDMDLCLMRLCQNGGSCLSSQGQTKCLCPPAYTGKYCQEKNVCHGNPCKNGGSCKAVEGVARCSCPENYEGALCQTWKCSKCDRQATCLKGSCFCNSDYTGDGLTCQRKTPDQAKVVPPVSPAPAPPPPPVVPPPTVQRFCDSNPCANGATCLEAVGTYFCQCPENKYGKQCGQTPAVIADLCSKCDIDATCRDGRCVCNEGFNGNGFTCRKSTPVAPEASTASTRQKMDSSCAFCPENGQCLDNVCVCPPGFENRKRSCVAIDLPRASSSVLAKAMLPGVEFVGTARNRLPIGQWKEKSVVTEYQSLGCWADTKDWRNSIMRAIESLEGLHPSLNDEYKTRKNPITKCATAAKAYGYEIFAIQNGGQCFADRNAAKTYTTYGPSTKCRFGVGGALANDVYKIPQALPAHANLGT